MKNRGESNVFFLIFRKMILIYLDMYTIHISLFQEEQLQKKGDPDRNLVPL